MAQTTVSDFEDDWFGPEYCSELPDRDFDWQKEPVTFADGLNVVLPNVSSRGNPGVVTVGGGCTIRADEFGYVVGGLEDYLKRHRDREIDIPQYYSRFESEAETYLGGVTAANGSFGLGAHPRRLETAVRAATGGGRFSKDTRVVGCGKRPFIVENSQGAFVFAPVDLGCPEGFDLEGGPQHDVAGLSVPDDVDDVRAGIAFLKRCLDTEFGITLIQHDTLSDGYHYFATETGPQLRIKGYHLKRLAGVTRDPSKVLGKMEYNDPWGEQFSGEWEEIKYPLGTPMSRRGRPPEQRPRNDILVGFARGWHDPRRTRQVSLSSRVKARAHYVRIKIQASSSEVLTAERKVHSETVDETRPKQKEELATREGT